MDQPKDENINSDIKKKINQNLQDSVDRIKSSLEISLKFPEEITLMLKPNQDSPDSKVANSIKKILDEITTILDETKKSLPTDSNSKNKNNTEINYLMSVHALISAYMFELELIEEGAIPALKISPAMKFTLQGWIGHIKSVLGKFSAWIFSIVKTMLTPTGWSLEGGVTVPGLVNANLKITFGP